MKRRHLLLGASSFLTLGSIILSGSQLRAADVKSKNSNTDFSAINPYLKSNGTEIARRSVSTERHTTSYLEAGSEQGPVIIFVHGWPELGYSWRHQLATFSSLGFRAIAPDLRGAGQSSFYTDSSAYSLREIVQDMMDLVDALGIDQAIWVGHDWGGAVVWSVASHHPERCQGVVGLNVPYDTLQRGIERLVEVGVNRTIYPEELFPFGQYAYYKFYEENLDVATQDFEANLENTFKVLLRQGDPSQAGEPFLTSFVRVQGGWFGPLRMAPDVPLDTAILTQEDLDIFVSAYERTGFFGVNSLYLNDADNIAYTDEWVNNGVLEMPTLFLGGIYDYINDSERTNFTQPMQERARRLTINRIETGHWMQQERPDAVNRAIVRWLRQQRVLSR